MLLDLIQNTNAVIRQVRYTPIDLRIVPNSREGLGITRNILNCLEFLRRKKLAARPLIIRFCSAVYGLTNFSQGFISGRADLRANLGWCCRSRSDRSERGCHRFGRTSGAGVWLALACRVDFWNGAGRRQHRRSRARSFR